jgi:hypothetical protein
MLGWAHSVFHKKRARTHYAKLVFLHMVGSVGYVVHSDASAPRNIQTPFFMLRWIRCDFRQKRVRTCYAELVFCIRCDLWGT